MKEKYDKTNNPKVPESLSWLFPYKRKGLAINTQSLIAYYLFQNKISLILINWVFQGMRSMGAADLIGKLVLDIVFIMLFYILINIFWQGQFIYQILAAIILAHSVNWLINAHFWDVGRFIGITRTPPDRFFAYIRKILNRVVTSNSIHAIIVIGGVSRNAGFRETSDVDMIFIKKKGFFNAINAVSIAVRERTLAFFCKFPLHLELYDSIKAMEIYRSDEVPIVLKDSDGQVKNWYHREGRAISTLDDYVR